MILRIRRDDIKGLWILIFSVIYRVFLDFDYNLIISTFYNYQGFNNLQTIESTILSYLLFFTYAVILCLVYTEYNRNLLHYSLLFLSLVYLIPGTTFIRFNQLDCGYLFGWNAFWIVFLVSGYYANNNSILRFSFSFRQMDLKIKKLLYIALVLTFVGTIIYISGRYTGFRFTITITDEYNLRNLERSFSMPTILAYLKGMATTCISVMLCIACIKRKKIIIVVLAILQILSFSIGGHKSVLGFTLLAVCIGFFYEKIYAKLHEYFALLALVILLVFERFEYLTRGSYILSANISRRVFFLPQLINKYYYDFFSKNPYDYWTGSFLSFLGIKTNYPETIGILIGERYMGPGCNACNGLYSEAFSNMGYLGCFVVPAVIILIIKAISGVVDDANKSLVVFLAIIITILFGSGNVSTALVTNVLVCATLIVFLNKRVGNPWSRKNSLNTPLKYYSN